MPAPSSALETPPQSPRLAQQPVAQSQPLKPRPESGFRKTYDDYVTRRAAACENCALTLPRRQEESGGGTIGPRPDRSPTLRTRCSCARVYGGFDDAGSSPPSSQTSSSTPSDDEGPAHPQLSRRRAAAAASKPSRSSASSSAPPHVHYLDYTSTHEPLAPNSFSIVRASCLRTLSFETTPRPTAAGATGNAGSGPLKPNHISQYAWLCHNAKPSLHRVGWTPFLWRPRCRIHYCLRISHPGYACSWPQAGICLPGSKHA